MPLVKSKRGGQALFLTPYRSEIPIAIPPPDIFNKLLSATRARSSGTSKEDDIDALPEQHLGLLRQRRSIAGAERALRRDAVNLLDQEYNGDFEAFIEGERKKGTDGYFSRRNAIYDLEDMYQVNVGIAGAEKEKYEKAYNEALTNQALYDYAIDPKTGQRRPKYDLTGEFTGEYYTVLEWLERGRFGLQIDPNVGTAQTYVWGDTEKAGQFQEKINTLTSRAAGSWDKYTTQSSLFDQNDKLLISGDDMYSFIPRTTTTVTTNKRQLDAVATTMEDVLNRDERRDMMQEWWAFKDTHHMVPGLTDRQNRAIWLQARVRGETDLAEKYGFESKTGLIRPGDIADPKAESIFWQAHTGKLQSDTPSEVYRRGAGTTIVGPSTYGTQAKIAAPHQADNVNDALLTSLLRGNGYKASSMPSKFFYSYNDVPNPMSVFENKKAYLIGVTTNFKDEPAPVTYENEQREMVYDLFDVPGIAKAYNTTNRAAEQILAEGGIPVKTVEMQIAVSSDDWKEVKKQIRDIKLSGKNAMKVVEGGIEEDDVITLSKGSGSWVEGDYHLITIRGVLDENMAQFFSNLSFAKGQSQISSGRYEQGQQQRQSQIEHIKSIGEIE